MQVCWHTACLLHSCAVQNTLTGNGAAQNGDSPVSSHLILNEIIPVDLPEACLSYDSLLYQADKNLREFWSVDHKEGNE